MKHLSHATEHDRERRGSSRSPAIYRVGFAPTQRESSVTRRASRPAETETQKGQKPKPEERRWIILAQDGRHVTMGRAAPPSEAEVEAAAAALAAQGLAGWLATLDGNYWSRRRVTLAPVQTLGDGASLHWPAAITAFEAARQRSRRPL